MKFIETEFADVKLIESKIFSDPRGSFFGVFEQEAFENQGITEVFLQDSISYSKTNVIRGLHYQEPNAQGKLVCPLRGSIFDVVVDIRLGSPNFKKWMGVELNSKQGNMLWIPPGFAHGFAALTKEVSLLYKLTHRYDPENQYVINWRDPDLNIEWPISNPILSDRDTNAPLLSAISILPTYT